jgi:2-methylisocitrate lyase-like PEP mutase family enzyme
MSRRDMGTALRAVHRESVGPLISPLAHDALSARLIAAAGFGSFNIGGSTLLAARHALPDLGLAALGEMAAAMDAWNAIENGNVDPAAFHARRANLS